MMVGFERLLATNMNEECSAESGGEIAMRPPDF
jgi:hypothetical protein